MESRVHIKVFDLLQIPQDRVGEYSVRLNGHLPGFDVMDIYYNHHEALMRHAHTVQWPGKSRRNISTPFVLQFIQLDADDRSRWLFIGCSKILPGESEDPTGTGAKIANYQAVDTYKAFEGRLVVSYKRPVGVSGSGGLTRNLSKPAIRQDVVSSMTVSRIAETPISAKPFPGYEQVRLTHAELVAAVQNPQWQAALDSVSAVYLITDVSNGWHYVGSAYSRQGENKGLLSRWTEYAFGDHTGGNKGLRERTTRQHIEECFQYSILEIFDRRVAARDVIRREHWWMDTLQSVHTSVRRYGYNEVRDRHKDA